MTIGEQRIPI